MFGSRFHVRKTKDLLIHATASALDVPQRGPPTLRPWGPRRILACRGMQKRFPGPFWTNSLGTSKSTRSFRSSEASSLILLLQAIGVHAQNVPSARLALGVNSSPRLTLCALIGTAMDLQMPEKSGQHGRRRLRAKRPDPTPTTLLRRASLNPHLSSGFGCGVCLRKRSFRFPDYLLRGPGGLVAVIACKASSG